MDWTQVLKDLREAGVTQEEIAEACGVAQSTVSDLARGASRQPTFAFGQALLELRSRRVPVQQ